MCICAKIPRLRRTAEKRCAARGMTGG